ncbi:MAG: tetratricopeptide repeat protein [Syntrophotalea acetylenica]|uniref:tetratricopeptide repeat protein n=1 Tax=Syntrophotalea acetylenica TaxID=29542 RepID=UPI002A3631E9|nr:tetratricopeptide repeat protein [Syntrophotalea acetylenica]MDD4457663.1 tetratricopeptide repeat protein [Syntrophotalea acetylenica]MDY0262022.1 tetratricopeptide repeat protein [Syntrophotalea acetylenica]
MTGKKVTYVMRCGKTIEADEVFFAWTSGDLKRMIKATKIKTNPIDRHHLLNSIVKITHKQSNDLATAKLCKEYCEKHLDEFPGLAGPLKEGAGGFLPAVDTFKFLADIYYYERNYEKAIEVCRKAISYGVKSGTKSGFEGMISNIEKRMNG